MLLEFPFTFFINICEPKDVRCIKNDAGKVPERGLTSQLQQPEGCWTVKLKLLTKVVIVPKSTFLNTNVQYTQYNAQYFNIIIGRGLK